MIRHALDGDGARVTLCGLSFENKEEFSQRASSAKQAAHGTQKEYPDCKRCKRTRDWANWVEDYFAYLPEYDPPLPDDDPLTADGVESDLAYDAHREKKYTRFRSRD